MTTITISETTKESPWMTLNQVAKYFSVSERTISRMIDHMSYGIHYVKANPYKKKKQINFPYYST
ncbi:hypothetical protein [uncultured Prochlorococcus sp.]|uniref:hypothetical protein n=1 Tax=uncultured Prochlorococcus sp. TaxID=159733 RepID=UPI00258DBB85|nr:hypothetical protein [uncultured Prochlorococcus sp.]